MKLTTLSHSGLFLAFVALFCLLRAPSAPAAADGQAIFQQKCAECHAMQPGDKMSIENRQAVKGTPLWFAGSKFQQEWLEAWLAKPTPLLQVKWNTAEKGVYEHPAVSPEEAASVTAYLMTAVDDSLVTGKLAAFPDDRSGKRKFLTTARNLFEKHQGCYACHRYLNKRGLELGGFSAPTLVTADTRLQADWVYNFLLNPEKYYPNAKCPIPGDKAVNKFTDEDKGTLATYIVNMGEK